MDIYSPREDSTLLQRHVKRLAKGVVLDMGTGSGIQAKAALENTKFVIGVDINQDAVDLCNRTIKSKNAMFLRSDLFSAFEGRYVPTDVPTKFDTMIFNAPYLPDDDGVKDAALYGGKRGYEIIEMFIKDSKRFLAKDGIILLVFSSFTGKEKVDEIIRGSGYEFEELERMHISFEDIFCYLIKACLDKPKE